MMKAILLWIRGKRRLVELYGISIAMNRAREPRPYESGQLRELYGSSIGILSRSLFTQLIAHYPFA